MKYGIRKPNLKKRISSRTTSKAKRSIKRTINPLYEKKGVGIIKNPKKSVYNKIYNEMTTSVDDITKSVLNAPNNIKRTSDTSKMSKSTSTFEDQCESIDAKKENDDIGSCFGCLLFIAIIFFCYVTLILLSLLNLVMIKK